MSKIKQCLKEERGSSLMIAIIILMVCTVLGGIVISAAAANLSRLARGRRDQQAYLTAESTALMLQELFEGQSLIIETDEDGQPQITGAGTDGLGPLLERDAGRILGIGDTPQEQVERELKLSGEDALADQQVSVSYRMNSGFGIELKVRVEEEEKNLSQMLVEIPASLKTQNGQTALGWKQGSITRLEAEETEEGEDP